MNEIIMPLRRVEPPQAPRPFVRPLILPKLPARIRDGVQRNRDQRHSDPVMHRYFASLEDAEAFLDAFMAVTLAAQHRPFPSGYFPVVVVRQDKNPPVAWLAETATVATGAADLARAPVWRIDDTEAVADEAVQEMFTGSVHHPQRILPVLITLWRRQTDVIEDLLAKERDGIVILIYACPSCVCGFHALIWPPFRPPARTPDRAAIWP